jgi:uncharacterized protein
MPKRFFAMLAAALAASSLIGFAGSAAWSQQRQDIRWGTGPVGSSGHKALVVLANLLNKQMPKYNISVLPTPGAVTTVKGFATGEFDGFYGSDIALEELANNSGRFKGFKSHIKRQPVQSLWTYTLDVGLAIKASNMNTIKRWGDLTGRRVYTGPLPFDTRKKLEAALAALGVRHNYTQVDLATAGSQLSSGSIDGMIIYAAGGKTPPPWITQASLAVDWAALNPNAEEVATLKKKNFQIIQVPAKNFHANAHVKEASLLPFYWGFDVGLNVPEEDLYQMLKVVDQHSAELGKLDPSFAQIAGRMPEFQRQALEATWNLVPIHPGLAKFLRERNMWNAKWDSNIAHGPKS